MVCDVEMVDENAVMKGDPLPENQMFKSFCDKIHYVDTSGPVVILKVDNKDELVSFYTDILLKQKRTVPSSTEMTFGIYCTLFKSISVRDSFPLYNPTLQSQCAIPVCNPTVKSHFEIPL